ncbi:MULTISPECIES: hypothetical protein [unclassified Aureimonas]|uniref:hypothetical protein n=1 Tax=unclassified Aureimonas TaxID=2615206 RepID=UPI0006FE71BD|nr:MULTISPECIES: hypothetical protein [unclassified Aureimonas]KQT53060.1 hypothetical protein ASG62_14285 [Aureimonas sp. Leaf427]KQT80517.1 hypothetical protein ASG54_08135 [Aureimonas sp. Leaf460]
MTDDKSLIGNRAAHAMMEAVQRQAIEIVALSNEAREVRYALILKTFKETAMGMGKETSQAEEAANKMVEWTRSMGMIIEAGGGAAGGAA